MLELGEFLGNVVEGGSKVRTFIFGDREFKKPKWLKLPAFVHSMNFILLHYCYLIFMTFLVSGMLAAAGGMPYIDALFFAAGAATQSGLNTIDVNKLLLYQQIVLIVTSCLCNPIIINTFVVFVRLYWFERRFQGVVTHARLMRGRTISRRKSEDGTNADLEHNERGNNDRHGETAHGANGGTSGYQKSDGDGSPDTIANGDHSGNGVLEKTLSSQRSISPTTTRNNPPFSRNIMFADEVKGSKEKNITNEDRIPGQRSKEEHIAFVEAQRKTDSETLWIPGPRDVQRGYRPQRIQEGDSSGADDDRDSLNDQRTLPPLTLHEPRRQEPVGVKDRIHKKLATLRRKGDEDEDDPRGFRSRIFTRTRSFNNPFSQDKNRTVDPLPYLSYTATIGRNSTFVDLTEEQREELGGIEYRALKTLAWILMLYYLGFFIISWIIMLPWIVSSAKYSTVVRNVGQSPTWWGFFTPMSMFTDLGFTLTPDSMVSFQLAVLPLLFGAFLIIAGNTGFPCLLRLFIWIVSKCVPYGSGLWEELQFLLDHPRRCFTLLFPRKATWWLFAVLVLLNAVDLIFYVTLDLDTETIRSLPPGFRFLTGLFQAASTRTAGFAVVNLQDLHPGVQVSYMIMMYISVFPIAISVRQTNVYEEKSLGIYGGGHGEDTSDMNSNSYIGSHLRRQLSFDLWYVFLGLFFITIIEGYRIEDDKDIDFTIFACLFEIVSAYGTVGLSLGYDGFNTSFSGQFKPLSKLIIIAMMLRGRHRGLPYALDRAILLPSESLQRKEQEMDIQRRERRASMASQRRLSVEATGADIGPHIGEISARTNASTRSRSRPAGHHLKRIVTGALSPGTTLKHNHF